MRMKAASNVTSATLSRLPSLAYAPPMAETVDDAQLMARFCQGDAGAFETLYRRHKDPLYRYLQRLSYDQDSVDDVFQDAWGKIIGARDRYRPTAKFRTFLFRVARNCFIDYLRRNNRHRQAALFDEPLPPSTEPGPDEETERLRMRERLERALADLPAAQRDAYLLHEEGGLSIEQIAEVTGSNREAAKSRLRYAIAKLRTALADSDPVPGADSAREAG